MSAPSSSVSFKAGDGVSDQFPVGLRVLVVDDNPTCLMILEKMLKDCHYEVTKCDKAEIALSLLRGNKNGYDIVISNVRMPNMEDGFKLLEQVGLEMDLPVIMMSADDSKSVVMKGVTHGACDYLIKPVRMEALKNIWQHVVRKKKHEWKDNKEVEQSGSVEDGERLQKQSEDVEYSSSANEGNWKNSKKRKDDEEENDDRDDSSSLKKPRVVWSVELHQQFVAAVNQLGIDKAVPKKILELMNVPGLTRENVASHLQKFRLYLRRLSGVPQHQNGSNPFMGASDGAFGSISSVNGLDLQALAASGQLPAPSLATLQAAALGRSTTKSAMPILDQRNLFSFETPKLRYSEGLQQVNNSKQMNLLHGIPMNMEPKQLSTFPSMNVNSSQVTQSNSLLMQMTHPQSSGSQLHRLQSSMGQTMLSNSIPGGVLSPKGLVKNVRGSLYNPLSQPSSMVDFTMNQNQELPGNGFPIMSNLASKGMLQEVSSDMKGSRNYVPVPGPVPVPVPVPNNDLFNDLHQLKPQGWNLPNVRSSYDVSQHSTMQGTMDVSQSLLVKNGQNPNATMGKAIFSSNEAQQRYTSTMGQQQSMFLPDNSMRIKSERVQDNTFFQEQFGQDDLMSALLKQQQDGIGSVDEFGFDGFPLDNLPV